MAARNVKIAFASIMATKWRSLLTVLGVVIGIVSVVTIASLGEGVKRQVVGQINQLGNDLITIRPGRLVTRDNQGTIKKINLNTELIAGNGSLSDEDLRIAMNTPDVVDTVPISSLTTTVKVGNKEFDNFNVIATKSGFGDEVVQKMAYGSFFTTDEQDRRVAVVSQQVGADLFGENVPLGRQLTIRGQTFLVRGISEPFQQTQFTLGPDFNHSIFIPYDVAKDLSDNSLQLSQILVRPKDAGMTDTVIKELDARLAEAHGGQHDFTVLKQDENLQVTKSILDLFTALIAGIASISLLVGGVGIMNIMLVSVTERTREIGIRKAVGATNRQILGQFITEAALLSLVGGILGIILAFVINGLLRITTDLQPVVTVPAVLIASAVSLLIGIVFGFMPAVRAARKDPIDALRDE